MAEKPVVGVVLVNYQGDENTVECLRSLEKTKGVELRIVIVDLRDNPVSEKQSIGAFKDVMPNCDCVTALNRGFSWANNQGAEYLQAKYALDYLLFLNNDTLIEPSTISRMAYYLKLNPRSIISPKIYFESGYEYHKKTYTPSERGKVLWYAGGFIDNKDIYAWHRGVDELDYGQFNDRSETAFVTGCCLMLSLDAWKDIGKWDENYFLYYEDTDYSMRAKKKKYAVEYLPEAIVWHKNAGSSSSGSDKHIYYQTRNRIRFAKKYAGLRSKLSLMKEALGMMRSGSPVLKQAASDGFFGRYGKWRQSA
jgi:GT2 family glycosyltransferase